jgi:hypothetical protein
LINSPFGVAASFQIQVSVCQTPVYKVIPTNYEGQALAFNHMLVTKCNTNLPVANNAYANYLMNNDMSNNIKMFSAGAGLGMGIMTGSAMGITSSLTQIADVVARDNQATKMPNQVTAITDGAMERMLFSFKE